VGIVVKGGKAGLRPTRIRGPTRNSVWQGNGTMVSILKQSWVSFPQCEKGKRKTGRNYTKSAHCSAGREGRK